MALNCLWRRNPVQRQRREIDIWRLQALFQNFRKILQLNNAVLEDMSRLEQTLGGEFIFDWHYLAESVRNLAAKVHHIAYNLNALTANAHVPLYDSYERILTTLEDILAGDVSTLTELPVLPLEDIGWELEPLVGINVVCLAELRHHPATPPAECFVVTSAGCRALAADPLDEHHGAAGFSRRDVLDSLRRCVTGQFGNTGPVPFSVIATRLDEGVDLVQEIARFRLVPDGRKGTLHLEEDGVEGSSEPVPQESPGINPDRPDDWPQRYAAAIMQVAGTVAGRMRRQTEGGTPEVALAVRADYRTAVAGTITTGADAELPEGCLELSARSAGGGEPDRYFLRRAHPFELLRSHIPARPDGYRFADARQVNDHTKAGLARGSALLSAPLLQKLSETAMIAERLFGTAVTLAWELDEAGRCVITQILPVSASPAPTSSAKLAEIQAAATVLCRGGNTVQAGVGAGTVVHVSEKTVHDDFPAGAVAVARYASPQLTPVLQRAAAVVTEHGSVVGHLATVARELRIPAVFGLPGAQNLLPGNSHVTVHAGDTTVYAGILDALLRSGSEEPGFSPFDREYRTLRRLLRFIMPLHLIDPDSPGFSPEGCRSFHDVIHFCHEKAVEELAHFQQRRPGLGAIRTARLQLGVPMDIRVLDIGGGMAERAAPHPVPEDVRSRPFAAFLDGLLQPQAWSDSDPTLGIRDIISAMPRSMNMLSAPADSLGANLAIVGHDYINVSLRLGYHFSVIDAHLGSDDSRNYVYFRFVGGLADPERRGRRARFIRDVLAAMDFKVSMKGDLVIGRKKSERLRLLSASLFVLGALTSFAKQRDTALQRDEDIAALFSRFSHVFLPHYDKAVDEAFHADRGV